MNESNDYNILSFDFKDMEEDKEFEILKNEREEYTSN